MKSRSATSGKTRKRKVDAKSGAGSKAAKESPATIRELAAETPSPPASPPTPAIAPGRNPARLQPSELAFVLARSGDHAFTETDILRDVEVGCPSNPDGTLGLVPYVAWLLKNDTSDGN